MSPRPPTKSRDERRANYRYWLEIASRWADCDAYGHVNNAVYYSWFDTALTTMLIERGVLRPDEGSSIGLCVQSGCEFFAPIEFPQTVDAGVRIAPGGERSLRYELALFPKHNEVPAAVGFFVHVFVDRQTRRAVFLTDQQNDALRDMRPPSQ